MAVFILNFFFRVLDCLQSEPAFDIGLNFRVQTIFYSLCECEVPNGSSLFA